jgi:hypothetical protein
MRPVAAAIFHAPLGRSPGERLVEEGREASARDLVQNLARAGVERIVLVSPDEEFAATLEPLHVLAQRSEEPFHFGEELKRVVAAEETDGLLYFGSGSGTLLSGSNVRDLVAFAREKRRGALFNNFYSCDFAAVAGARDLLNAELPPIDNSLGFSLAEGGFPCFSLPRDAGSQFDIDTPTDLFLLAAAGRGGEELRAFLERNPLVHPAVEPLLECLADRSARLYLVGRVNPSTWAHFEREVACRTSGLVEGRGLRAYPDRSGTFLARVLYEMGPASFLRELGRVADGAILDTRPLLARAGELPPPSDRFACDLFRPDLVKDPLWKEFTAAAIAAPIPILLGGHSLVSGGLYLLAEACWKGKDLPLRLHPNPIEWTKERP